MLDGSAFFSSMSCRRACLSIKFDLHETDSSKDPELRVKPVLPDVLPEVPPVAVVLTVVNDDVCRKS